jgi:Lysyl oxidase
VLLRLIPGPVVAILIALVLVVAPSPDAGGAGRLRLPDLEQEVPRGLVVLREQTPSGRVEYQLGFRSATRNVGDGPLVIDGVRHEDQSTMVADQVVDRAGGPRLKVRDVGRLRYVVSPDHRHWHLLGFERYELRRPGARVAVAEDHKTGFCLGDRYAVRGHRLARRAPHAVYRGRCGLGRSELLGIREGISVGYGDDYVAGLEGQELMLTGLPGGRYVLVHRVNGRRRLHETSYANNAASLLLRLRWRLGVPYVQVLARCPDTPDCAPATRPPTSSPPVPSDP